MRGFGRVLNPSLPVGSTPCKGSLGLLSAQTVGIAALSDPNSCPMSANYLQGHRSEAPGTSSQCKVDKLVNDQPAGDKHDTDQQQGTQDSPKLARFSPLLAYIALTLKVNRKPSLPLRACALHRACPESFPSGRANHLQGHPWAGSQSTQLEWQLFQAQFPSSRGQLLA